MTIETFIHDLPKCELHVHIEGRWSRSSSSTWPRATGLALPFKDAGAMRAAYVFHDLPSFLALYYGGMDVLLKEPDFYDLAMAYLAKARSQNVLYAEIFFDPQAHTAPRRRLRHRDPRPAPRPDRRRASARRPLAADHVLPARLERGVRHGDAAGVPALQGMDRRRRPGLRREGQPALQVPPRCSPAPARKATC